MNVLIGQLKSHLPNDGNRIVAVESTIAGYHAFRVQPLSGMQFPLLMMRESSNPIHSNAVMVKSGLREKYPGSVGAIVDKHGKDIFDKKLGAVLASWQTLWLP